MGRRSSITSCWSCYCWSLFLWLYLATTSINVAWSSLQEHGLCSIMSCCFDGRTSRIASSVEQPHQTRRIPLPFTFTRTAAYHPLHHPPRRYPSKTSHIKQTYQQHTNHQSWHHDHRLHDSDYNRRLYRQQPVQHPPQHYQRKALFAKFLHRNDDDANNISSAVSNKGDAESLWNVTSYPTFAPSSTRPVASPAPLFTCAICQQSFYSRNSLFRHLQQQQQHQGEHGEQQKDQQQLLLQQQQNDHDVSHTSSVVSNTTMHNSIPPSCTSTPSSQVVSSSSSTFSSSWNIQQQDNLPYARPLVQWERQSFVFCFGYYYYIDDQHHDDWISSSSSSVSLAEASGDIIEDAFFQACQMLIPDFSKWNDIDKDDMGVGVGTRRKNLDLNKVSTSTTSAAVSSDHHYDDNDDMGGGGSCVRQQRKQRRRRRTQASLARLRPYALQQDYECPAGGDVVVISTLFPSSFDFLLPKKQEQWNHINTIRTSTSTTTTTTTRDDDFSFLIPVFLEQLIQHMNTTLTHNTNMDSHWNHLNNSIQIKLLSCKWWNGYSTSATAEAATTASPAPPLPLSTMSSSTRTQNKKEDDMMDNEQQVDNNQQQQQQEHQPILNHRILPTLHAERSTTQYVYHYLMPLRWLLVEGNMIQTWMEERAQSNVMNQHTTRSNQKGGDDDINNDGSIQSRHPLRLLKQILRSAESKTIWKTTTTKGSNVDSTTNSSSTKADTSVTPDRIAKGRFGALGCKVRRSWHNFANPSLQGNASPNHACVWRVLDRARIIYNPDNRMLNKATTSSSAPLDNSFVGMDRNDYDNDDDDAVLIIEFRGDAFLQHQVCRIVGTAVAAVHGWLPAENIFHFATQPDIWFNEMPLAPSNRLYLAGTRFHFDEAYMFGQLIFETNCGGTVQSVHPLQYGIDWIQDCILVAAMKQRQQENHRTSHHDTQWLVDVKERIAPQIMNELRQYTPNLNPPIDSAITSSWSLGSTPDEYSYVLRLLRAITAAEQWPETSQSRSSVIRQLEERQTGNAGSFTVINPSLDLWSTQNGTNIIPLGNRLFPELTKAVFDLEKILASTSLRQIITTNLSAPINCTMIRPSSSHCAINSNAQFTPHVDSGHGAGQSLSMIVGLGDYSGGELMVEGHPYKILYNPLQFDGWRLRHWTNPFCGERFSLVWFTPQQ